MPRRPCGREADGEVRDVPSATLFDFDRVALRHGSVCALTEVTAAVAASGITAIAGPSGAGKTSLLRLCNRLEVPTSGSIRFEGRQMEGIDTLWLRRRVGMVFQQPTLFAGTVRDNLRVALPGADEARCRRALRAAVLDPGLLDRPASALSGGEAQRACLARTLVTDPRVLLLDEPTTALDTRPKAAFEEVALDLAAAGTPLLWVTHDLAQLRRIADQVLVLAEGSVAYCGDLADLGDAALLEGLMGEGRA